MSNSKYKLVEQDECMLKETYTNSADPDETPRKHTLIHFALIGDKSSKGVYEEVIVTNIIRISVKIAFREVNIGSIHTFCTH